MQNDLKSMKGISELDRKMMEDAEIMLGPEPEVMGFVKNLFWGRVREDLIFPYPEENPGERETCDSILTNLRDYLSKEHPRVQIDQEEHIPDWAVKKLFKLKIMGMNIPVQYGGQGLGVTSYNRALDMIGSFCASTAVMVSAHQSIGCKAIVLFGTEEQKKKYLPKLATESLSAFCLSEPNVGSDAGGQETRCQISEDGKHFILNGEKKWATSGALAEVFTVIAKQKIQDTSGKAKEAVTALICTPDMEGIEIFQKNRSKCGIRGTWQARIRFKDVHVPRENLLHKEGKGLQVALTCLDYGRCTLSAGMVGAARTAMDQGIKYSQSRHQFNRPLAEFELMQKRIANMWALTYAMDAMLYMTTGFLDRHDKDIMVETAICKVFCSEMGWRVVNDAVQIMGGESYMTENELERIFRDSRINLIVEGANEVMQSFIFGYGGKKLAEHMVGIQNAYTWDSKTDFLSNFNRIGANALNFKILSRALSLAGEMFLGLKKSAPPSKKIHRSLETLFSRFAKLVVEQRSKYIAVSLRYKADIVKRQAVQARVADASLWLHGMACVLSKLDQETKSNQSGRKMERKKAAALHFLDMAELEIKKAFGELDNNADPSMLAAASAALEYGSTLDDSQFILHERSPVNAGKGRKPMEEFVKQFPGDG